MLSLLLALTALPQEPPPFDNPRVTPIVLVARKAAPAVVYIEAERQKAMLDFFGRRHVEWDTVGGSGVVVDKSGYIVTNHHVTADARKLFVTLFEEGEAPRRYPASLISSAPHDDLALLKIETEHELAVILRGTSSDLMLGETVVAIGNPLGQTKTVSAGIISGLNRDLDVPLAQPPLKFKGLIQTDAAINPGNSGGPLLNIEGQMIGINTAIREGAENMGFAIPVDRVEEVLRDLLSPSASRAWFGFEVDDNATLCVNELVPGSPAALAGMELGYRLLAINGARIKDGAEYRLHRLPLAPNQTATFTLAGPKGDREYVVTGWDRARGAIFARLGMEVSPSRDGWDIYLRLTEVAREGPAQALGLRAGDVIDALRIAGQRASVRPRTQADLADLLAALPPRTEIEIDVLRDENGDQRIDLRTEVLRGVLVLR
ncbi:MAG: trypsin-like peptidase domain-containing protein [Planctomycetes bacterium]|nr:trypsin-like peptidase domain-containing protein [Planctomycetota bacterium]